MLSTELRSEICADQRIVRVTIRGSDDLAEQGMIEAVFGGFSENLAEVGRDGGIARRSQTPPRTIRNRGGDVQRL